MNIHKLLQRFLLENTRRYWTFSVVFAGLTTVLLAACSKVQPVPFIDTNSTVLAFGDSLTFGTGAASGESYPAQLGALIGRKVVAAGVPGEVSADGLARLPQALEEYQPKLLLLCHGGNDFLRKLGDDVAAANVRAMVKLAKDKNIAVMLIATPKPGFSVAPPAFYADIAKEFSLPIEEKSLKKILTENALKSDLVHPNAKGYRLLAEDVAALLKRAGAV
jgi:acyl-CoA thioesterase I